MVLIVIEIFVTQYGVLQVLEKGLRFTIRDGSKTLGYGVVSQILDDVVIEALMAEKKAIKKAARKAAEAAAMQ